MSKAPAVKPTAPVQAKPMREAAPAASKAPVRRPEDITLDYEVQAPEAANTPVPTLNVPGASASARQLAEGTPVLHVPDAPAAPDFAQEYKHESKA